MDVLRDSFFGFAGTLYDKYVEKQGCGRQHDTLRTTDPKRVINQPNIFRRDACTDAFGKGWTANTCTPGNTLCCVKENASFPTCTQQLGIGWCCTASGGCYADLSSSCGQPGAVSCTELASGVDEACCPRYTACAEGYNATESFVRCNIKSSLLAEIATSSTSLSGVSTKESAFSSTSSTKTPNSSTSTSAETSASTSSSGSESSSTSDAVNSTASSALSTPTPNALPNAEPSETVLSSSATSTPATQPTGLLLTTGEIVGIVVASACGGLFLVALGWILRRRNRSRRKKFAMPTTPLTSSHNTDFKLATPIMLQSQHGFSELAGEAEPVELSSSRWSRRPAGVNKHVSVAGTYELDN